MSRYHFKIADANDNAELCAFSRTVEMSGAIRLVFDHQPDYLGSLSVEGSPAEVLVCRDTETGRVVGSGHRSVKSLFVDGTIAPVGYLSGLRLDRAVRHGQLLAQGYDFLHRRHADGRARFYLTTLMEDNRLAQSALLDGRCGLPAYHDFGRFHCMAIGLQPQGGGEDHDQNLRIRAATTADGPVVVAFLQREGRLRQFFPSYRIEDFAAANGLLAGLQWEDILLAFRDDNLVGVVAAWDQRDFRRWQIQSYAPWLGLCRGPANLIAGLMGKLRLPEPGSSLNYFILSLVCIQDNDRHVFATLLNELIRHWQDRYDFFLAGLHERDLLLPELQARRHFPLPSRLFVVAWEDGAETVQSLDPSLVPYLELGAL